MELSSILWLGRWFCDALHHHYFIWCWAFTIPDSQTHVHDTFNNKNIVSIDRDTYTPRVSVLYLAINSRISVVDEHFLSTYIPGKLFPHYLEAIIYMWCFLVGGLFSVTCYIPRTKVDIAHFTFSGSRSRWMSSPIFNFLPSIHSENVENESPTSPGLLVPRERGWP